MAGRGRSARSSNEVGVEVDADQGEEAGGSGGRGPRGPRRASGRLPSGAARSGRPCRGRSRNRASSHSRCWRNSSRAWSTCTSSANCRTGPPQDQPGGEQAGRQHTPAQMMQSHGRAPGLFLVVLRADPFILGSSTTRSRKVRVPRLKDRFSEVVETIPAERGKDPPRCPPSSGPTCRSRGLRPGGPGRSRDRLSDRPALHQEQQPVEGPAADRRARRGVPRGARPRPGSSTRSATTRT